MVEEEDEAEGEGMFANLDSVSGTLLNISEGSVAIRIEMDQVMFWSGDPKILFGETRAGVMSMEEKEDGHILHLHFTRHKNIPDIDR